MNLRVQLRTRGDAYLCLAAGVLLGMQALLGLGGVHLPAPWQTVQAVLGFGMLLLPGYACAILAGLDRHGIETVAGISVALSLAIMALAGTAVWLLAHTFSISGLEAILASCLIALTIGALWRRSRSPSSGEELQTRWAALGLIVLPLSLTVGAVGGAWPASPATHYTEFSIAAVKPRLTVAIVNREGSAKTYDVAARLGSATSRTRPVTLQSGQRWQGIIRVPSQQSGLIRLFLDMRGESSTMELWVWHKAPSRKPRGQR